MITSYVVSLMVAVACVVTIFNAYLIVWESSVDWMVVVDHVRIFVGACVMKRWVYVSWIVVNGFDVFKLNDYSFCGFRLVFVFVCGVVLNCRLNL